MQTPVQDRREMMINQLVMRGYASMKEILTASFGEWPPKGLDMNPGITHEQKVAFKPFIDGIKIQNFDAEQARFALERILAYGLMNGERNIYINDDCMEREEKALAGAKVSTLGHEAIHVLQGDHYYRAWRTFGISAGQIMSNQWVVNLNDGEKRMAQKSKTHALDKLRDSFNKAAAEKMVANPAKMGMEIQARIHEIMIGGYQRWGRLPLNKEELWTALASAGVKLLPEMSRHLESLPKDSGARDFACLNRSKSARMRARDIEAVNNSLSHQGRVFFWQKVLPGIYADLLEMYGDKLGRERFFPDLKNPKRDFVQLEG